MAEPAPSSEALQEKHFNDLATRYEAHYFDATSRAYRSRFLDPLLTNGIPLQNARVLEAMCGTGQLTAHLQERGAHVTGLDISDRCIERFRENFPACEGVVGSVLHTPFPNETFDAVVVLGGIHHLHPDTDKAIEEIMRILKPGGYFCFLEAHEESWMNHLRNFWYRRDHLFEKNERAISVRRIVEINQSRMDLLRVCYGGNLAYLFVLNSMIWRIPLVLKRLYAPALMALETLLHPFFRSARFSFFAAVQMRKRS